MNTLISTQRNIIFCQVVDGGCLQSLRNRLKDEALKEGIIPGTPQWDNRMKDIKSTFLFCPLNWEGTAFELLEKVNELCCGFHSKERVGEKVSRGELKRWFERNAVTILGKKGIKPQEKVGEFFGLILFAKGNRITII